MTLISTDASLSDSETDQGQWTLQTLITIKDISSLAWNKLFWGLGVRFAPDTAHLARLEVEWVEGHAVGVGGEAGEGMVLPGKL